MSVNVTLNRRYSIINRYNFRTWILLLSLLLLLAVRVGAQSPTSPALNFNAFFLEDAEMSTSETEGPMAVGGNLKIKGNHDVAAHSGGTFQVGGITIGLLVGGKVHYEGGNSFKVLKDAYVKIGQQNNSKAWYKDPNNSYSPIRITPGDNYDGSPRIELSAKANTYSPEVSASGNPVFEGNLIDFAAAFAQMQHTATSLAACMDNAHLTNSGNQVIGRTNMPNQVRITLNTGINILNISGTEMNKMDELNFMNTPSPNHILIINVNAPGSFNWNVYNSAGSFGGLTGSQYILYNFYNTTSLTIQGNGAVQGTVFAPFATVTKSGNNANIEGQIIAKSFKQQAGGEIHYAIFLPDVSGCSIPSTPPAASFTINADKQCIGGNSFSFTSTSTGTGPLTYKWHFDDGNTATTQHATHTYAAAGTYSVKLVVTDAGGKDSVTKTVNVWPAPVTGFTVNNAAQTLPGNSFVFTTSDHASGNTYKWYFDDGSTSTSQNPTHSYVAAGTYTVKQVITSNKSCKDSTTLVVTVTETPTDAKFTINDDKQCLDGNSFSFTSTSTGAAPLTYKWYFDDGNTATTQHATHTYAAAGTYSVKLVVTGAGGKDSVTKTVNVWPAATPGFTVNNAAQALIGNSFVFTTSNHASGNAYKWYFDDGNTSAVQNPTHSYAAAGTYTVKQVITTNKGCKDSTTLVVTVTETPTDAKFTINNDKQCLDGNSFSFTSTSTGAAPLTYLWNFGDGNTATTQNATHTYATAGTYIVKLVVTGAGSKDSISKTVIVDAPQAGFSVSDTIQYLSGNSFQFTSTYSAHHYHWIFDDGNTSNAADPVHSYAAAGTYQVKQIVYTEKGCMAYVYKTVKVIPEVTDASFTINNDKQCLGGNSFSFTNTSTGAAPLTYAWSFGDGNTSAQASPVYSYGTSGNFTVQLIVTGVGGSDTATLAVTVDDAPVAGFTVNEATQELTGNSFVFTSTATGANTHHWAFGDQSTSSDLHPVKSFDSAGTYEVTLIVTAVSGCADTAKQTIVVLSDSVSSGNDGGIESESMGGLVTKRDFNRIRNSVDTKVDYAKTAAFMPAVFNAVAKGTKNGQELADMIPAQLETGDAVYITSPTDLLTITSAVDVLSVDYTRDQKAKAVALGIKTLDRAYSHTKSICDRFRGAELLFVEDIKIQGYDFTRFALKRDGGIVEYAIAFVVGKDKRRDNYTLQTNWLLSSYEPDEDMYNFQVWSAHPDHAVKLAGDVLDNLKKEQPVQQINALVLPKAYITYGMRDKENLIVRINNTTNAKSGRLVFEERINEDAGLTTMEIPLDLVPGKDNVFVIPIKDGYEYQGSVYLDGVLEDEVYMADGNWGIDYDNSYTVVERFERGNNKERVYKDGEYPVYRNVTLQAKSRDYVSIYKAIRSGTEKADLTAYKSLKFYAQGNGEVEVRLTRDSIVDWRSQYKTVVQLTEKGKEYTISFDDFLSDRIEAPFNPKDVKTIVFTYNTGGGKSQDVTLHISDVSFSQEAVTATRALDSRTLTIAPNPNEGKFECRFVSDQERILNLNISDVTGKIVFSRSVDATLGMNAIPVDLNLPSGTILFISLKGSDDLFYDVQKTVIR